MSTAFIALALVSLVVIITIFKAVAKKEKEDSKGVSVLDPIVEPTVKKPTKIKAAKPAKEVAPIVKEAKAKKLTPKKPKTGKNITSGSGSGSGNGSNVGGTGYAYGTGSGRSSGKGSGSGSGSGSGAGKK